MAATRDSARLTPLVRRQPIFCRGYLWMVWAGFPGRARYWGLVPMPAGGAAACTCPPTCEAFKLGGAWTLQYQVASNGTPECVPCMGAAIGMPQNGYKQLHAQTIARPALHAHAARPKHVLPPARYTLGPCPAPFGMPGKPSGAPGPAGRAICGMSGPRGTGAPYAPPGYAGM